MPSGRPPANDGMGTPYAPSPPPANVGMCSWCGQRQSPDLLVLMNADGSAGICEICCATHERFFGRRRAERKRSTEH